MTIDEATDALNRALEAADIASRADGQVREMMEATAALMAWVKGQD